MITISAAMLRAIAPGNSGARGERQTVIIEAAAPVLQANLPAAEINTVLRVAHFLAQICEESDGFCTTEEYASGEAYEGRLDLGNTQPGDGVRFKGRGLIELTGRANYVRYEPIVRLPLVDHPELASDPVNAVNIAISFWIQLALNPFADANNIKTITSRINGGWNGLSTRQIYLARAKLVLGAPAA